MKKYFFLFALLGLLLPSCDEEEETQVCSCSSDFDEYYYSDSLLTEGIFIPNAFTPNFDGRNDVFAVAGTGISSLSVVIKDGNTTVFQTANQSIGWDGTVNGNIPDFQTFDYVVDAVFTSGTTKHFESTITLYGNTLSPCPDNILDCVFGNTFDGTGFNPGISNGETFGC